MAFLNMRSAGIAGLVAIVCVAVIAGSVWSSRAAQVKKASQAYMFALPLVMMDVTREQTFAHPAAVHAGPNRLYHIPILSDHTFRTVVRPNVDTIYSTAWLDLSHEPVVLDIPPGDGRYHVFQFMDAWTNVFFAPGIRTLGNERGRFLLAGPAWTGQVPEGYELVRSPTDLVWLIGRIFVSDASDLPYAAKFQSQVDLRPLSQLGSSNFRAAYPDPSGRGAVRAEPLAIIRAMSAEQFFSRYLSLIDQHPVASSDADFVERVMAPFGLLAGTAGWSSLSEDVRRDLERGKERVLTAMSERAAVEQDRDASGWAGYSLSRQIGQYGNNYPLRAAVALFGLGANLPDDAIYLNASSLPDGTALRGGNRYELTFPAGALPPVRGFWSLTAYDRPGFLMDTGEARYGVRSSDALRYNEDGSLTIFIASENPGAEWESNWIPVPNAVEFVISMRLYWPEEALLKGEWQPPPIRISSF